jgi:hypothetical protein
MSNNNIDETKPEKEEFFTDFYETKPLEDYINKLDLTQEQELDLDMDIAKLWECRFLPFCMTLVPEEKQFEVFEFYYNEEKSESDILKFMDETVGETFREKVREKAPTWRDEIIETLKKGIEAEGPTPSEQKG